MSLDLAHPALDWHTTHHYARSYKPALLLALLLSLALHGVLWAYLRSAEIPQSDPLKQDAAAVISMHLIEKAPALVNDDSEITHLASPPMPPSDTRETPTEADVPPQAAPVERPRISLRESIAAALLNDEPSSKAGQQGGIIFDSRLRRKLEVLRPTVPQTALEERMHVDNYGDEWVRHGDSCAKVIAAIDHQDQAALAIPTLCKGAASENDFERGFRARLRAKGLK